MRSLRFLAVTAAAVATGSELQPSTLSLVERAASEGCTRDYDLEVYLLQDGTASFKDFLPKAREVLPQLVDALSKLFVKASVGVGVFGDRPSRDSRSDYCFEPLTKLTPDIDTFTSSIKNLQAICNGGDRAEDSLETLGYVAGSAAGFTPPADGDKILRLGVIVTDVQSHYYEESGAKPPSSYPNPDLATNLVCEQDLKYPPVGQISEILRAAKVHPLILATNYESEWEKMVFDKLGFGREEAAVLSFDLSPETLVDDLLNGILDLECSIETSSTTTTTTTTKVTTATEESESTGGEGGQDTTLPGGETTVPGGETGGETTAPGGETGGETTAPGGETGGETTAPGGVTTAPGGGTTAPGGGTTAPGGVTTAPGGETTAPGGGTTLPGGHTSGGEGGSTTEPGDWMTTHPQTDKTGDETGDELVPPIVGGESGGGGVNTGAIAGASAGIVAVGALAAGGYMMTNRGGSPHLDIEMEAEDTQNPAREVQREAQNPTESADYGEYKL
eukprot:Gregarina_sp_Pseudo_9__121@NODE_1082_length_1888_cov_9_044889_g1014_i0_p1_GENE_NODE_1082_length_1888_cov_9_044889_g1014_i0NODE_1082_length_1888_cov_9_044889_g1014_i0_p1_ORF_typecomplete_len505_score144_97Integrin_beta/PF00362_18/5_6e17_NODE_1082_length_1888_cov_9_044889_g1014_i01081622